MTDIKKTGPKAVTPAETKARDLLALAGAELPAGATPERAPTIPAPVTTSAPTRLPRLRRLSEREVAALSPARRAAYQTELAHQEQWGHLPLQVQAQLRGVELSSRAVEVHAREAGTDPVHFAAARAFHRWPLGQEMSREQYDAALVSVLSEPHGR